MLKVRDRLERDRVTLSAQGFSKEDEYLLQAFARMISVKIAIRAHLLRRESEQRAQSAGVAHAYRHDLTNLLRAAMLRMRELPATSITYPACSNGPERWWIVHGRPRASPRGPMSPKKVRSATCAPCCTTFSLPRMRAWHRNMAAMPTSSSTPPHVPPDSVWVHCDRHCSSWRFSSCRSWLHHHLDATTRADPQFQLKVRVSAERTENGASLNLVAPTACDWPQTPDEDAARAGGDHLCYTNLLICPLIPWDALANEFRHYNATLDYRIEGGTTRAWVTLTDRANAGWTRCASRRNYGVHAASNARR